ncbi:hypothetical protein [Bacillus badius]|uniref:Phage protein n=1 Tax=Bacillus badius TaxID=1455 RepID=A0ABR5ATZ2_BACBA|nr:hypothetical protein [Bacillus badius]KIL78205.1 hypothetical protein SD77_0806 [Bacillus badius]MED4718306.1 hypothetical protein [Bacillus badius]
MKDDDNAYEDVLNKYKKSETRKKYSLSEIVGLLKNEFGMAEFNKKEVSDLKKDECVSFKDIQYCLYTEDKEALQRLQVEQDAGIEEPEKELYRNEKEFARAIMYYKIQKGDRINVILEGKKDCLANYTVQGESEYIYKLLDLLRGAEEEFGL